MPWSARASGSAVTRGWLRLWFDETDRYDYGLARILLVVWLLYQLELADVDGITTFWRSTRVFPLEFASEPLALRVLPLPFRLSVEWAEALVLTARILLVTSLLGIFTRGSLLGLTIAALYILGLRSSWGAIDQPTAIPVLALLALTFAPGVDRWSVDGWWRRRRSSEPEEPRAAVAAWPARLIMILLASAYFAAAWHKIALTDGQWLDGNTLAFYLSGEPNSAYFSGHEVPEADRWRDGFGLESFVFGFGGVASVGRWIAGSTLAVASLSCAIVAFEFGYLFAMLSRRLRQPWLLGAVAFHVVTFFLMNLDFLGWACCNAACVDWRGLRRRVLHREKAPEPPATRPSAPTFDRPKALSSLLITAIVATHLSGIIGARADWPRASYEMIPYYVSEDAPLYDIVISLETPEATRRIEPWGDLGFAPLLLRRKMFVDYYGSVTPRSGYGLHTVDDDPSRFHGRMQDFCRTLATIMERRDVVASAISIETHKRVKGAVVAKQPIGRFDITTSTYERHNHHEPVRTGE